jgi:hypothetical protein
MLTSVNMQLTPMLIKNGEHLALAPLLGDENPTL